MPKHTWKPCTDPMATNMTHMVGVVYPSYDQLVRLFGPPTSNGDPFKTDAMWDVEFSDGTVATIYNWKNGPAFGGPPVEQIKTWNVGGHGPKALTRVRSAVTSSIY